MRTFVKTFLLLLFALAPVIIFAATGSIDPIRKYAWGENIGWVNFVSPNGNITVSDTGLSGYAWSENYGWINLNPSTAGIKNDGVGNLSGKAWGEGIGWIDFLGVKINAQGEFTGYATVSQNQSKISFNCVNTNSCGSSNFGVKTTWRPVISPVHLLGDLNNDRTVNGLDWSIMAGVWFSADPTADLNKDGVVNSIDFSLLNQNWGRSS